LKDQPKMTFIQPSFQYSKSPLNNELDYLVLTCTHQDPQLQNLSIKIAIPPEPDLNYNLKKNSLR